MASNSETFPREFKKSRNGRLRTHVKSVSHSTAISTEPCASDSHHNLIPLMEFLLFQTGSVTRLPLRQIFRYQTVCKHWRQVISEFLRPKLECKDIFPRNLHYGIMSHREAPVQEEERWFIMTCADQKMSRFRRLHTMVFSDREEALFKPPQIPTSVDDLNKILGMKDTHIESFFNMKSSNGLIFALVEVKSKLREEKHKVIVFNCFTGYARLFPCHGQCSMLIFSKMRIALHPDDVSRYYILHSPCEYGVTKDYRNEAELSDSYVYDSAKGLWKRITDISIAKPPDFLKLLKGDFFFYDISGGEDGEDIVSSYNVVEDSWISLHDVKWKEGFEVEGKYDILAFEKCNVKLLLCIAIKDNRQYIKFKVCELIPLSNESAAWVEVSSLCLKRPYPAAKLDAMAFAEGNVLCCYFRVHDRYSGKHPERPPPVLYDMVENNWDSLPQTAWPEPIGSVYGFDCSMILRPWLAIKELPLK